MGGALLCSLDYCSQVMLGVRSRLDSCLLLQGELYVLICCLVRLFVRFVAFTVSYSVILCFHFGVLSDFAFLFGCF